MCQLSCQDEQVGELSKIINYQICPISSRPSTAMGITWEVPPLPPNYHKDNINDDTSTTMLWPGTALHSEAHHKWWEYSCNHGVMSPGWWKPTFSLYQLATCSLCGPMAEWMLHTPRVHPAPDQDGSHTIYSLLVIHTFTWATSTGTLQYAFRYIDWILPGFHVPKKHTSNDSRDECA